jgi:hypothetical protein
MARSLSFPPTHRFDQEGVWLRNSVFHAVRARARLDRRPFEYDYEHHFIEHEHDLLDRLNRTPSETPMAFSHG